MDIICINKNTQSEALRFTCCSDTHAVACQQLTTLFLWTGVQKQLCLGCTCCWCQVVIFEKLLVVQDTHTHMHTHSVSLFAICVYSEAQAAGKNWGGCVVDSSNCWQSRECEKLYSQVLKKMTSSYHQHLQSNTSIMQLIFTLLL